MLVLWRYICYIVKKIFREVNALNDRNDKKTESMEKWMKMHLLASEMLDLGRECMERDKKNGLAKALMTGVFLAANREAEKVGGTEDETKKKVKHFLAECILELKKTLSVMTKDDNEETEEDVREILSEFLGAESEIEEDDLFDEVAEDAAYTVEMRLNSSGRFPEMDFRVLAEDQAALVTFFESMADMAEKL